MQRPHGAAPQLVCSQHLELQGSCSSAAVESTLGGPDLQLQPSKRERTCVPHLPQQTPCATGRPAGTPSAPLAGPQLPGRLQQRPQTYCAAAGTRHRPAGPVAAAPCCCPSGAGAPAAGPAAAFQCGMICRYRCYLSAASERWQSSHLDLQAPIASSEAALQLPAAWNTVIGG